MSRHPTLTRRAFIAEVAATLVGINATLPGGCPSVFAADAPVMASRIGY